MDYDNMDSEVIESLDLLRPPVKRKPCDEHRDIVYSNTDNLVQDVSSCKVNTVSDKRSHGDSTSLILRKTSGGQILKQYSTVCYTSHYNQTQLASQRIRHKDKPLIKVTVIPKQGPLGSKVLGKPKVITKAVQSTSSNHENSVQTKHLYLVVAGRKRNKIYEIKTTGNANVDNKPIKDEAIEFGTINSLVNALDMEKKRKKEKKDSRGEQNEAQSISESIQYKEHVCTCEPGQRHEPNDLKSGKSRVKVYGRIGLTRDDKYIVNCQATVNDKPVPIISTVEKQSSSSSYIPEYHDNTTSTYQFGCMRRDTQNTNTNYQRDFKLQTDFYNNVVQELHMNDDDDTYKIRKVSQSTQVNFNYKPNDNNMVDCDSSYNTKHRVSKCNCVYPVVNTVLNSQTDKSTEFERNNDVKSHQSPLVIISVYPKQDDNLADIIKTCTSSCVERMQTKREQEIEVQHKKDITHQNENEINQTEYKYETIKEYEDIEPKPVKNAFKKEIGRSPQPRGRKQRLVIESRHVKTSLKNDSSLRSSQKSTKGTLQSHTKKESTNKTRKPSPARSPRPKSPTATSKSEKNNITKQNPKPRSPKTVDKGVNTEHLQEKKALIECYTKKLDEQMSSSITYKGRPSANSVSKVSVNIDSDNKYYDVSFRQDYRTTDLNVRKTMKDAGAQNNLDDTKRHGSLENYFPNMSRRHERSYCQCVDNQSNDTISIVSKSVTPRLTLRDSLEVSHRREDKNLRVPQARRRSSTDATLTEKSDVLDFFGPTKHYPGDDCDIGDPVERDREIRLLLGVKERRQTRYYDDDSQCQDYEMGNQSLRRCFSKQCETPSIIPPNCTVLNSTNVNQIYSNITKCKPALSSATYELNEPRKSVELLYPQTKKNGNTFVTNSIINTKSNETIIRPSIGTQPNKLSSQNVNPIESNSTILKFKNIVKSYESNKTNMESKSCHQQTSQNDNQFETNSTILKFKNIDKCHDQTKYNKETKSLFEQTSLSEILNKIKSIDSEVRENIQTKTVRNTTNVLTQYEDIEGKNAHQQFNFNRNIQVFLQVSKQKPIVLSRKQYSKVRKTIQSSVVSGKDNKKCIKKRSIVSIGLVRDIPKKNVLAYASKEVQTEAIKDEIKPTLAEKKSIKLKLKEMNEKKTIILYSRNVPRSVEETEALNDSMRQAVSSVHIRYASMEFSKDVTFSSTNEGSIGSSSYANRSQPTIETLFKQHRRPPTPNLGTSALSLLSTEAIKTDSHVKLSPPTVKVKKPFLKRLMSCLVMRSSATAKAEPPLTPTILDSSVDSYHISTAFGAIEMTSSIYDTTASFYSNHTIHPLSSKFKRGFFSSVIGLLTNRKS